MHSQAPDVSHHGKLYLWGAIIIALASIAASFLIVRNAGANADYICTDIIEVNGDCTNGSWGAWQTVSSSTNATACAPTQVEKRIYTGTRTTSHILQYLNRRTACEAGYSQVQSGGGGGASGYKEGKIITESSACQIEETRTTYNAGAACANPTVEVTSLNSDIAALENTSVQTSSLDQLTQFRISMIAANIYAKPALVRSGGTTVIKWQGREVTACTVTGSNGDSWEGTSGEKTSGIINAQTTYTLSCTAFNGQNVTDQALVTIIPQFQEI